MPGDMHGVAGSSTIQHQMSVTGSPLPAKRIPRGGNELSTMRVLLVGGLLMSAAGLLNAQTGHVSTLRRSTNELTTELPAEPPVNEDRSAYGMVAAGVPEAARAGALMLEKGGNAVDAAVAAAFATGVVDPLNAGLGGQCYVLIHLRDGRDIAVDGSAPAPLRVKPEEIRPLRETGFLWGYKLAATPATPAALAYALKRYGTKSLAQVLAPAIELAEYGHRIQPSIRSVVDHYADRIRENEVLARTFLREGLETFPPDHVYCQSALADTLRRLAEHGVEDFYSGRIAEEIAADMAVNGGYVSKQDLGLLHVTERVPVRGRYRGLEVVAFPYPGGGEILVEALQILDVFPRELLQQDTVDRLHLLLEAMSLAILDAPTSVRAAAVGAGLSDPTKAQRRAGMIRYDHALRDEELPISPSLSFHDRDTTHVSVVDRFGNAVALTQTNGYGGFVATPTLGFEYNSLLEGFDFCDRGSPNFLVPLSTARTTMTPTVLLCDGKPFLVLGGAGSARIPATIVCVVTNVVDRGMSLREAVVAPRALASRSSAGKKRKGCRTPPVDPLAEQRTYFEMFDPITPGQLDALLLRGFLDQKRLSSPCSLYDRRSFGGVNTVMVDPATGMLVGVGDPRRCGGAAGQTVP
jgi:gamma-glutamyltranspeptidase/glutathione hydrolase